MSQKLESENSNISTARKSAIRNTSAVETDPLIRASRTGGSIRVRRGSKSPVFTSMMVQDYGGSNGGDDDNDHHHDGYESIDDVPSRETLQQQSFQDDEETASYHYPYHHESADSINTGSGGTSRLDVPLHQSEKLAGIPSSESMSVETNAQPPLLEIPEEVYAVRKAALRVLKPLTKTWVRVCLRGRFCPHSLSCHLSILACVA